jgi:hypothetical protein
VNILNIGPSEHLEGNLKVRLKWDVENVLSESKIDETGLVSWPVS